ncbi:unnamed protein product [Gongylonema pulchrum]|uniref:Anoct_dimer domain-containing protein n=1 Tax=Gongylonema pulchrum TaxID=637853 RepID=A0A183EUJ7_9BILA|nr:unnamed protein product [Gongylonema pulchrum]
MRYAYFSDGRRRIDYVLAYEMHDEEESDSDSGSSDDPVARFILSSSGPKKAKRRRMYEQNLLRKGLELEFVRGELCSNIGFVLVHIPFDLLCRHAEKLGIEMRVRLDLRPERKVNEGWIDEKIQRCGWLHFDEKTSKLLKEPRNQYHPFTYDEMECYDGYDDPDNFFSSADRIYVVHDILCRTRFGQDDRVGIDSMLQQNIYCAAYPLHEVTFYCPQFSISFYLQLFFAFLPSAFSVSSFWIHNQ